MVGSFESVRPNERVESSLPVWPNKIVGSFELVGADETVGSFDPVGPNEIVRSSLLVWPNKTAGLFGLVGAYLMRAK